MSLPLTLQMNLLAMEGDMWLETDRVEGVVAEVGGVVGGLCPSALGCLHGVSRAS